MRAASVVFYTLPVSRASVGRLVFRPKACLFVRNLARDESFNFMSAKEDLVSLSQYTSMISPILWITRSKYERTRPDLFTQCSNHLKFSMTHCLVNYPRADGHTIESGESILVSSGDLNGTEPSQRYEREWWRSTERGDTSKKSDL